MTAGQIEYRNYLKSWRWKLISATRKWSDGYQCRTCHEGRRLNVHHASYVHRGAFGIVGIWREYCDTITLCNDCHEGIHNVHKIKDFAD